MKKVIFTLLIIGFSGLVSCGGSDDTPDAGCSTLWATELQNELNAIVSAGSAFSGDPSAANCNAYKDAYNAYINALAPYGNCGALSGQSKADFDAALLEAKASLADLC